MNKISKKVVLLGHFGVGKTSLIRRFVENVFSEEYKVSIGVNVLKKDVVLPDNKTVTLVIWDLEGLEDVKKIRMSYLLGSHAFIYVYDLTRTITNKDIIKDLDFFKEKFPDVPIQVIGNKYDLVNKKQLLENKTLEALTDYYTSAKSGENVETLFIDLATRLIPK